MLPPDFDALIEQAVNHFWAERGRGVRRGRHLDGFGEVIRAVAEHTGLPSAAVFAGGRRHMALPGYFRAAKEWDALVVHQGRLLAAFEFKSIVDEIGKNQNNRSVDVIGDAVDVRTADRERTFSAGEPSLGPPFLGFLMLVKDGPDVHAPVRRTEERLIHFPLRPEYRDTTRAEQFRIMYERLVQERFYDAVALVLSAPPDGTRPATASPLSEMTGIDRFFRLFAGRMMAEAGR